MHGPKRRGHGQTISLIAEHAAESAEQAGVFYRKVEYLKQSGGGPDASLPAPG